MNDNKALKAVLESSNISDEQKQAIMDAIKNDEAKKTSVKTTTRAKVINGKVESFGTINKTNNITKIDRPTVESTYMYKNIPCKFDLFKIFYLADTNMLLNKNSNLLGAFMIKWINEGKLKYKFVKGGMFRKDAYVVEINPDLRFENEYENEIFKFIKRACDGDNELTAAEFRKFAEKKQFEVQNLLDEICDFEEKKLVEAGLLKIDVDTTEQKIDDTNNPLNTEGITITNTKTTQSNSKELINDIKNIIGFKTYMKSVHDDTTLELSNDFFVVTELLGISNFVAHKFNKVYPEFYFRHLQFLHHIRSSAPEVTSAFKRMMEVGKMQIK